MSENGGNPTSFVDDAESCIGFDEAMEGFGNVGCGLIVFDDRFKAVYCSEIMSSVQVKSTDFHLLAGEMVPGQINL